VRTPQTEQLREILAGFGATVTDTDEGLLEVSGLTAQQIGEAAAAHTIVLHELTPHQASLEEAFMDLTRGELEFAASGEEAA
jgi:ABC-2 type transport system ATP-binding protein